jgi:hypothetical protein
MSKNNLNLKDWAVLGLFSCLTVIMLYPLSIRLFSMVPEPTDPLLNAWRMQWNAHAFLGGPESIANLFNTNIFYPFPLTLAYSEHFLMIAAQALPFLLLADSHLFGMNLSVLLTFVLSGYGMYLLMSDWTRNRWAGLVAGVLFAYSPQRFGQLNHLELLVTQWLPLALLALHWTLTRRGRRYPALFIIFFNLQALSGFHYALNLAIACGLLLLVYTLTKRVSWRKGVWLAGLAAIGVTFLLNWPIWRMYLRFSDVMGAIRTPGEVRVYSAALTDYLTTIPHNFLYGWSFGRWQPDGHQFQPLMPVGVVGLVLAIIGLIPLINPKLKTQNPAKGTQAKLKTPWTSRWSQGRQNPKLKTQNSFTRPTIIFLLSLTLLGLLLSFGTNEEALGPALSPLLKFSPYHWLYNNVAIFQGIRVPGRFGILVALGLSGLAGYGISIINLRQLSIIHYPLSITLLLLLEAWSAPLVGPEFPAGQQIPQVYHWLRRETAPADVVLELPFQGPSEFIYEYYSSHHWRRLANGGTGFTPPIYKDLRQWFNAFPDPRSVDVIRQMGIDWVILHAGAYPPETWQRIMSDLPRYLPAIEQIRQIENDLILRVAKSPCVGAIDDVAATITPTQLDGLSNVIAVNYHNIGTAAFVSNAQQTSRLTFANGPAKNFTEPLVTPAGESQTITVPLLDGSSQLTGATLSTLERTILPDALPPVAAGFDGEVQWQPLGLQYEAGPRLDAYALQPDSPTACGKLAVALRWDAWPGQPGESALVQLFDPFGRVVAESKSQPWTGEADAQPDIHALPLVAPLPPGQYGLRVFVNTADGAERLPVTGEGVTIPTNQIPPLPVVIHPAPRQLDNLIGPSTLFDNTIHLLGGSVTQNKVSPGDWLRFGLVWQIDQAVEADLTVFTQLLGPAGQVWGQQDNKPGGGWYEVSLWQPGRPVVDDYAFQIKPDAPPGAYRLIAGLYHSNTLQRLSTNTGADFVELGHIVISDDDE